MSGIDRRTLIAAAGTGLLVAGCGGSTENQAEEAPQQGWESGSGYLFGHRAQQPEPDPKGQNVVFDPDRICIVLLRFEASGLIARRTYIDVPVRKPTKEQVATAVLPELVRLSAGTTAKPDDRNDIDPIRLKGQRILVIYLDNKPTDVRFKYDPKPENEEQSYDYTLRFAPYSGADPKREIKKNNAFFHVQKITFAEDAPITGKVAFLLDYWDTDENGNKLTTVLAGEDRSHYRYSLNILVEIAAGGGHWVPLIVDPDTGNMGSEP